MHKVGSELKTRTSIIGLKCGDTVLINGESYEVCGYYMGEARYVKGKTGQIFRVITVIPTPIEEDEGKAPSKEKKLEYSYATHINHIS